MSKPNAEQVGDAVDLIKDHHRQYGAAATEARLSSLVYSIYSVLTGDGKPAADHEAALEAARQAKKPKVEEADGEVKAVDEKSKADEAAAKEKADAIAAAEKAKADKAAAAAKAEEEAAAAATMPPSKQANKATSE